MLSRYRVRLVLALVAGMLIAGSGLVVAVTAPSSASPHQRALMKAPPVAATVKASYGCVYPKGVEPPSLAAIDTAVRTRSPIPGCILNDHPHVGTQRLVVDQWPNPAGYAVPDTGGGYIILSGPIDCNGSMSCDAGWADQLFRSIPIIGTDCVFGGNCLYENYMVHDSSCSGAGGHYNFMACKYTQAYGPFGLGIGESIAVQAHANAATYTGTCNPDFPYCQMNDFAYSAITIGGCPLCASFYIISNQLISAYGNFSGASQRAN